MVTLGELKKRFGITPCEGLGDCVVIFGDLLDLDWILMFLEEGYRFEGTRLNGHPAVLVSVKKLEVSA
jgi:hypothetical protein